MTDIREQLLKLEERKSNLIEKRKSEIMDLVIQTGALAVDNAVLAGALLFIANSENKKDPIIGKFKELTKTKNIKLPSRRRNSKK